MRRTAVVPGAAVGRASAVFNFGQHATGPTSKTAAGRDVGARASLVIDRVSSAKGRHVFVPRALKLREQPDGLG